MHLALKLIDRAIEIGQQELACLAEGDVDRAEALAFGRDSILDEALAEKNMTAPAAESLDTLVAKLVELKDLQARIIDEASRLRQSLGEEIRKAGQEQKRHAGYGQAARPPRLVQSRFISRSS